MSVYFGAHNIISPLGLNTLSNFEQILKGNSGVRQQQFSFSSDSFCCSKIDEAGIHSAFSKLGNTRNYTFAEQLCILSIQDVLQTSPIDLKDPSSLIIFSSTKGNIDILENKYPHLPESRVYLSEMTKVIADFFKCKNTPLIVSNACISGLLAIILANRFIKSGQYKNIIVCGIDIISEFTLSGFKSFNALSAEECKPFDANRTGINLGEAAASILVSADPISQLVITSGSSANDANHISGPSREGSGLYQSLLSTLKDLKHEKPDFINAHGTATEYNDEMEAIAFSRANIQSVPMNSLKAYYGHTLGAAGVLESILALQSLSSNKLIGSRGFENKGTSVELNIIKQTADATLNSCLKTASGFGGCNASAIYKKMN